MNLCASRRLAVRIVLAAATFAVAVPVQAQDDPAGLIRRVSGEVIELIKANPAGTGRELGIRKVLENDFDLPAMGQTALARYWDSVDEPIRQRFLKAAVSNEARAYSARFGEYGGQTLDIGAVTKKGAATWVESKLNQTNGQPIKIEWEVRTSGGRLRITDVKVEGVSMVMTRQSDYKSFILSNGGKDKPAVGVEALVAELERRAAADPAAPK